jgi:hypothetical protein
MGNVTSIRRPRTMKSSQKIFFSIKPRKPYH